MTSRLVPVTEQAHPESRDARPMPLPRRNHDHWANETRKYQLAPTPACPSAASLSFSTIAAYTCAHAGKSLIWHTIDVLTLSFLTLIAHVPNTVAVVYFLIWFASGAVAGLVFGRLEDGKTRSVPLFSRAVTVLIFFSIFFEFGPRFSAPSLFLEGLLLHIAYAWLDVPANSVIIRLSQTEYARRRLSWWRGIGGIGASICATALIAHVAFHARKELVSSTTSWPLISLAALSLAGMSGFCVLPLRPVTLKKEKHSGLDTTTLPWTRLGLLFTLAAIDQAATQSILRHIFTSNDLTGYILRLGGELFGMLTMLAIPMRTTFSRLALLFVPTTILGLALLWQFLISACDTLSIFLIGLSSGINGVALWFYVATWSPKTRESEMSGVATFLFKLALATSNVPTLL